MDYEEGGLRLRLVGPPPDLAPYLSAYYRTEIEQGAVVEDWLPPEEANLRTGQAEIYTAVIGDGPMVGVPAAVISGPTDRVTRLRIGGGKFWGVGLTPAGWRRFIGTSANDAANRFRDLATSDVDASIVDLFETLRADGDDIAAANDLINNTFRTLLGTRPSCESTIHAVHLSVLSGEASGVGPIASMAGMNPRTFERFCKRHFGFSGQVLLKRQRFLRSLGKYMLDPSMRWIGSIDTHYWDQAHFIRDFRSTMHMTPSAYAALPHPIVKAAVAVTNAGSGVAHQALYRPEHASTEDETRV